MKKNIDQRYKINDDIIQNYVDVMNSITEPVSLIKEQLDDFSKQVRELRNAINETMEPIRGASQQIAGTMKPIYDQLNSINSTLNSIKQLSSIYPNDKTKISTNLIKQIMEKNNGIISSRMIEPLNISRQYLTIMEKNNDIEKISRGIYLSPNAFEDSYYSFQIKYRKAIFSHMHALYFHGMTEEFPYNYTVTVPQNYHVKFVNEKCNVFYVADEFLTLGICDVKTPSGNIVKAYDIEKSICDIIRSKNRLDIEQVKKAIKNYVSSDKKNISKLSDYSTKMGINEQVMELVGMYND